MDVCHKIAGGLLTLALIGTVIGVTAEYLALPQAPLTPVQPEIKATFISAPPKQEATIAAVVAVVEPDPTPTPEPTIEPTPAPTASPAGTDYATVTLPRRDENWDALLQAHFGTSWQTAKAVMTCESGGNANAIGDRSLVYWVAGKLFGYSIGLFQIRQLPGRPSTEQLLNPEFNIQHAAGMWRAQGWKPWTCAKKLGII